MASGNLPDRSRPPSPARIPFRSPARPSSSSLSLLQRGLHAVSPKENKTVSDTSAAQEDAHGPVGLNLLSEPSEPHVDFIFVHGLGGGSRKTWSYSSDPSTFWPKEWLPSEPGFQHVRIHSYGYNADWLKTQQSILGIDDFGQALLIDMVTSPHLRKNRDTRIVLIAHSMGGLVAKKAINNDFRNVSSNLHLWSFYEALPMKSVFVVEKDSAVIGLPGEQSRYLQADHRQICKFESTTHPNYQIVLGYLLRTVEDLEKDYLSRHQDKIKADMKTIAAFLEVEGPPEADLLSISEKQLSGTCSWLTGHPNFSIWLSGSTEDKSNNTLPSSARGQRPRFLWVHGPPGSGKSVMCSHVIRFLQKGNFDCYYYFLKHGNTEVSTPSALLRSLAFQMALRNLNIQKDILTMVENHERISHDDHNKIWNDIFMGHIFKTSFSSPQFWVIDALDECPNKTLNTLLNLLSRIPPEVPLQVFLTSRPGVRVQRALGIDQPLMVELETGGEGTKLDIASFLRSRRSCVSGSDLSEHILSGILSKSNGIFLWASMVMDRLDHTYAEEDMEAVLHEVSGEMDDLYTRIANKIANTPNLELVKCIFQWIVCTPRRLSVDELREAVRLDINRTLTTTNDRLAQLCGHLITINRQSKVHFIHRTVYSFLIQKESELQIKLGTGHVRLAEVCLRTQLRFVAAWVRDLAHIVAAFGSYLDDMPSCIRSMVPIISPPQSIIHQQCTKNWRRQRLLGVSPAQGWNERISSFIYERKATAVAASEQYLAVGISSPGLKCRIVIYDSNTLQAVDDLWHEENTIRGLEFGPASGSLVAYGTKEISLWDKKHKLVWRKSVKHPQSPVSITFNVDEDELLVCAKGGHIYVLSAEDGSHQNELPLFHSGDSDSEDDGCRIPSGTPPSKICMSPLHGLAAITYRCSPVILWDIHRQRNEGVFYRPGTSSVYRQVQVHDLVFNPLPEMNLLAIAYDGVGIVTCDPWTREQLGIRGIEARILVSSRDGRTLFAGDLSNAIHILTFEPSPKVLHYLAPVSRAPLRDIAVSPDGLRIYDVRDRYCNVWEPSALGRSDTFDDTIDDLWNEAPSDGQSSVAAPTLTSPAFDRDVQIACIASSPDDRKNTIIFCGRRNGAISIYDATKGTRLLDFHLDHDHTYGIKYLVWHERSSIILAVNEINQCIAARVSVPRTPGNTSNVVPAVLLFSRDANHPTRGALINDTGDLFLIVTSHGSEVWDARGELVNRYDYNDQNVESDPWVKKNQWLQHPTDSSLLVMLRPTHIHVFRWSTFEELTPAQGVPLTFIGSGHHSLHLPSSSAEWVTQRASSLLVRVRARDLPRVSETHVEFLDLTSLSHAIAAPTGERDDSENDSSGLAVQSLLSDILNDCKATIGMHRSVLYFLDSRGWVKSVTLEDMRKGRAAYTRHFFVPRNWMVGENLQLRLLPRSYSVAMAHQGDLLIFEGFLDLEEKVPFVGDGALVRRWTEVAG
ncbi:hypothetical protein VTJ49DRAFT_5861 [Mycothermus thermophilus]|uniref:GPI inositol-deacylase n=1 Tax=Humicola insolens TaxID=85995 RepID=A0ABR3V2I1_HUMIN